MMSSWTYLALVGVLVIFDDSQARDWCYTRTYTNFIQVPVRVCRQIGVVQVKNPSRAQFSPVKKASIGVNSLTAKQVIKTFPGLFLNQSKADEMNKEMSKIPGIRPSVPDKVGLKPTLQHDGDLHCPTFKKLVAAPDNLRNIKQESKEIIHFPSEGVFQFIHKGTCGSGSVQSCTGGGCHQEKSIVYLMVCQDNPDWPTGFEPFEVQSYCSCKGILL